MRTRWIALGAALVGAACFALASIEAWWTAGEVAIGPFGTHHCFGGDCRSTGLSWLGGSDLWMRSAVDTRAAAIIASTLLVVLAGALAARRTPRLVAHTVLVALAAAIATGGYFVAGIPPLGAQSLATGPFFYAAGIVGGLAAALLVRRLQAPHERKEDQDHHDQPGRAQTGGAPAAVAEATTEKRENE